MNSVSIDAAKVVRLATLAMGTRFELVLVGDNEVTLRAAGEQAIEHIEWLHRHCSKHDKASAISRINQATGQRWIPIDGELADLLSLSLELGTATAGWFDVCVSRDHAATGPGFEVSGQRVRFSREHAQLDLGGIAKGWALDRAAEILRDSGIECALLHGGTSSVVAIGTPPDGMPWRIALQHPKHPSRRVDIDLVDESMGISGLDGKDTTGQVMRPGHVTDPSTGQAACGAIGAACIAQSCAVADAWSTALLASGGQVSLSQGLTGAVLGADDDARWYFVGNAARATTLEMR